MMAKMSLEVDLLEHLSVCRHLMSALRRLLAWLIPMNIGTGPNWIDQLANSFDLDTDGITARSKQAVCVRRPRPPAYP